MSNEKSNIEEAFKSTAWSSLSAEFAPHFFEYLKNHSKNVYECERVQSLEYVTTVPALYDDGNGTRKQVIVPMKVFTQDIDAQLEEAKKAVGIANQASEKANEASMTANDALAAVNEATEQAAAATSAANTAAKAATDAAAGITDTLNEQNTKIGAIGKKLDDHISDVAGNKGGNTYNVTSQIPLASGYYTLTTAIAAVPEKNRSKGLCITYEESQGKWITKQFVGTDISTWNAAASWEDFGGGGTVKTITLNGEKKNPDVNGNVNIDIPKVEVDESLDQESTNPVQNKAIVARLNELEASALKSVDVEPNDDETAVHVTFRNKRDEEITSADFPMGSGGGGGGGDTSLTKVVISAHVDNSIIKVGGHAMLSYTYDHQYASGDDKGQSTGQKATIEVQMKLGATTIYSQTLTDVSAGTYQIPQFGLTSSI